MCRSRRDLSNAHFLAKFGLDTVENEPCQVAYMYSTRLSKFMKMVLLLRYSDRSGDRAASLRHSGDSACSAALLPSARHPAHRLRLLWRSSPAFQNPEDSCTFQNLRIFELQNFECSNSEISYSYGRSSIRLGRFSLI